MAQTTSVSLDRSCWVCRHRRIGGFAFPVDCGWWVDKEEERAAELLKAAADLPAGEERDKAIAAAKIRKETLRSVPVVKVDTGCKLWKKADEKVSS